MSSYIIGKIEYMKMAGAVAGICRDYDICGMTEKEIIDSADLIYMENVASVNMQYRTDIKFDKNRYMGAYNKTYNEARWAGPEFQRKVANDIIYFFRSVLYQIEDQECEKNASVEICRIIMAMHRAICMNNSVWGQFNVRKGDKK